jgi:hypothetical protein
LVHMVNVYDVLWYTYHVVPMVPWYEYHALECVV